MSIITEKTPIGDAFALLTMEVAELRKRRDELLRSNIAFEAKCRTAQFALSTARMAMLTEVLPKLVAAAAVHSKEAASNIEAMGAQIAYDEGQKEFV